MRLGYLLIGMYALGASTFLLELAERKGEFPLLTICILLCCYFTVQGIELSMKLAKLDTIGATFYAVEIMLLALVLWSLGLFADGHVLGLRISDGGFGLLMMLVLVLPVVNRVIRQRAYPAKMTGGPAYYRLLNTLGILAALLALCWTQAWAQVFILLLQLFYLAFAFANKAMAKALSGKDAALRRSLSRDPDAGPPGAPRHS